MNARRFPKPPKREQPTPEPELGAEPPRMLKTLDVTQDTPAPIKWYECPACQHRFSMTWGLDAETCPGCDSPCKATT